MNKVLHIICIIFSLISILFICVDEKLIQGFIPCIEGINPNGVNGVISIIGGSFIAGYIFYLLTFTLPNYIRTKEANKLILKHIQSLVTWVDICNNPINTLKKIIEVEKDKFYYPKNKEYQEINQQLITLGEDAKPLILNSLNQIYKYFPYLTTNQLQDIENISQSLVFVWSNYLKGKEQISVSEIKILIDKYDELKTNVANLEKSVK